MTEEEKKAAQELEAKLDKKFDSFNEELTKASEFKEQYVKDLDGLREELKKCADKEYAEKSQTHIDTLEGRINELETKGASDVEPIEKQMDKFFETEEFKIAKSAKGKQAIMNLKADTISTSNSFTQTNSPIIPYMREPGVAVDPRNPFILTQLFARGVTNSDNVDWVERSDETVGAAAVAEEGAFAQSDLSWTSYVVPVKKIGGHIKVTREKLEDTDYIRGEIMEALGYQAPHMLEYYLWNGTGSSNQIYGILGSGTYNQAPSFSKPSGVETVQNANEYDVLAAAILQVELGANTATAVGYMPNAIIVHPVNYYNMTRLKDTRNQYLVGMDGIMRVNGVPIYKSTRVTAGTYLVGDFSQGKLYMRRNTEIRMWEQNENDVLYDRVTFTVSNRAALKIAHATTGLKRRAFVYGTFAAGIAAIGA